MSIMFPEEGPPCKELGQKAHPFRVSHPSNNGSEYVAPLSLFEHRLMFDNKVGVMYAGGHVSALSFHPTTPTLCAIAAHRQDQQRHNMLKCYKGRSHIQLWNLSLESKQTYCVGVVPHNGNCTWDLKWRPQPTNSNSAECSNSSSRLVGTLAAALGDGTAIVATFHDFDLPHVTSKHTSSPPTEVCTLTPKVMYLRGHKKPHQRCIVRVAEWSPDGTRLVLGLGNGTIEVYEASSQDKVWPRWCLPVQDAVITGLRWLDENFFCSVSIACVLRLRDMRDPISSLEQNQESLASSFAMTSVEPSVAVVATDAGTLRVIKLTSVDGVQAREPVKRIYLQTNSVRDVQSVSETVETNTVPVTLLYAGGSEGIVHECIIPRPIWPSRDSCHLPRTDTSQKMRWVMSNKDKFQAHESTCDSTANSESPMTDMDEITVVKANVDEQILHLSIECAGLDEHEKKSGNTGRLDPDGNTTPKKKPSRRSRAAGRDGAERESNLPKTVLVGQEITSNTTITRISLSQGADLIAVGMDDGFVTWLPMKDGKVKQHFVPPKIARQGGMATARKKLAKGPRGRPRKYPKKPVVSSDEESANEGVSAMNGTEEVVAVMTEEEEEMVLHSEGEEESEFITDEEEEIENEVEVTTRGAKNNKRGETRSQNGKAKGKKAGEAKKGKKMTAKSKAEKKEKNETKGKNEKKGKKKEIKKEEEADKDKMDVEEKDGGGNGASTEKGEDGAGDSGGGSRRSRRLSARLARARISDGGAEGVTEGGTEKEKNEKDEEVGGKKKKFLVELRLRLRRSNEKGDEEWDEGKERETEERKKKDGRILARIRIRKEEATRTKMKVRLNMKRKRTTLVKQEDVLQVEEEKEVEEEEEDVEGMPSSSKKRRSMESDVGTSTTSSTPTQSTHEDELRHGDHCAPLRRAGRTRKPSWRVRRLTSAHFQ